MKEFHNDIGGFVEQCSKVYNDVLKYYRATLADDYRLVIKRPRVVLDFKYINFLDKLKLIYFVLFSKKCDADGEVVSALQIGNISEVVLNGNKVWENGKIVIDPNNKDLK
jgi:hypothetical protein